MSWHAGLPWDWIRAVYRKFRGLFFTRPRPEGAYLRVTPREDETATDLLERLEWVLGQLSYAPNWEQSYNKRGEQLNLARIVARDVTEHPEYNWWQTHVRGWIHDDGSVWLRPHHELEPTEHPTGHLNGVGFDPDLGLDVLAADLTDTGVDYEERSWSRED